MLSTNDNNNAPTSVMVIHFWSVDNQHGTPRIGFLIKNKNLTVAMWRQRHWSRCLTTCQTTQPCAVDCPSALPVIPIAASYSCSALSRSACAKECAANDNVLRRNVRAAIGLVQDPFWLSALHCLLLVTIVCAHLRCAATAMALMLPLNDQQDSLPCANPL